MVSKLITPLITAFGGWHSTVPSTMLWQPWVCLCSVA